MSTREEVLGALRSLADQHREHARIFSGRTPPIPAGVRHLAKAEALDVAIELVKSIPGDAT